MKLGGKFQCDADFSHADCMDPDSVLANPESSLLIEDAEALECLVSISAPFPDADEVARKKDQ